LPPILFFSDPFYSGIPSSVFRAVFFLQVSPTSGKAAKVSEVALMRTDDIARTRRKFAGDMA
jgi:hypothetical protein